MKAKAKYYELVAELDSIHRDLTDECVDRENAAFRGDDTSDDFWYSMISSCLDAANMRAAEFGVTLPRHLEV
jgi:hypothetical protein